MVIMVIVASSKYQIARNAPSEDSLCAGWVPFRENSGGLLDENGVFSMLNLVLDVPILQPLYT